MLRFILISGIVGLIVGIYACSPTTKAEDKPSFEAQQKYKIFAQQFDSLTFSATDTLSCELLMYGEMAELTGNPSGIHLANSEIRAIIPEELLIKAAFDSTESHYALGRFPFTKHQEGFLIGAYANQQRYSTHFYLYDHRSYGFTHTLSLNYSMGGGAFLSQRRAWLCDINDDQTMDVVYRLDESLNTSDTTESYLHQSLHAEIWNGYQFVDYEATDFPVQVWDSILVAQEIY